MKAEKLFEGEILWIRCRDCEATWMMDYQPTPSTDCLDAHWKLGFSSAEGSAITWSEKWTDRDGNECYD